MTGGVSCCATTCASILQYLVVYYAHPGRGVFVRGTPTRCSYATTASHASLLRVSRLLSFRFRQYYVQLCREQTGFVEGVWQERRRLETELGARGEEVERLRASENVTRAAAKALEGRAEELSVALRRGQAQAKHDAQAAAAASTRDAMEALRRQLDDLRREVDKTKQEQAATNSRPSAVGTGAAAASAGAESLDAASGLAAGVGGDAPRAEGRGVATAAVVSSAVLEGEFQRLRAKYEKAKGRIAALEELVAASRRVSTQARKEFQVRTGNNGEHGRTGLGRERACVSHVVAGGCMGAGQWLGRPPRVLFTP